MFETHVLSVLPTYGLAETADVNTTIESLSRVDMFVSIQITEQHRVSDSPPAQKFCNGNIFIRYRHVQNQNSYKILLNNNFGK